MQFEEKPIEKTGGGKRICEPEIGEQYLFESDIV